MGAGAVAVDAKGDVFVSGMGSNNVLQIVPLGPRRDAILGAQPVAGERSPSD
jgi:hypothetical protein